MTTQFIVNHLWQSSCFVLVAELLALVLRRNSPKVRYWVWLSASLKFLIPFALLVGLGTVFSQPARHAVSVPVLAVPNTVVQFAVPFSPPADVTAQAHGSLHWVPSVIGIVWVLGFLAVALARCRSWLRVQATLRAGTPIELPIPVRALVTPGAEEPGIVGFLRPVLVLPAQLQEHLNPQQFGAILMHEMCHVRRRDNLFAGVHMAVEAIFWFHPLIWWVGSRMLKERELACDEEVLHMGCEPADYVQGILKVCRFYMESPLPCISGVTGADVKKRLRAILAGGMARELNAGKKAMLAAIGLAALAVPVLIGVLNAPQDKPGGPSSPTFQVATTKPAAPDARGMHIRSSPPHFEVASIEPAAGPEKFSGGPGAGRATFEGTTTLETLINMAYDLGVGRLAGPSWISTEWYAVSARYPSGTTEDQFRQMLANLLAERLGLAVHQVTKEVVGYELTVAPGGPKLTLAEPEAVAETSSTRSGRGGSERSAPEAHGVAAPHPGMSWDSKKEGNMTHMTFRRTSMAFLGYQVKSLLSGPSPDETTPVIDRTGLTDHFDFDLEIPTNRIAVAHPFGISKALEKQVGLKLNPVKTSISYIFVDHARKLSTDN